jgi:serine kinase of HPr protein (carbohydrate metabolism regulator)
MRVRDLSDKLQLNLLAGEDGLDNEVTGGYCGDLLSWVMGRAKSGDAWITVMGNLNAVAVAVLADCACIILSENASLDDDAIVRANRQGVPVLKSDMTQFELCVRVNELLK